MRRAVIALAGIVIIGASVLAYQQFKRLADSLADKELTQFIEDNMNQVIVIEPLMNTGLFEQAEWQITDFQHDVINSTLLLQPEDGNRIRIPITSTLTRGEVAYKGKIYDYGKIVSQPDLSQFKQKIPALRTDTITVTHYITSMGDVAEVIAIAPIETVVKNQDNVPVTVQFKGGAIDRDFSFLNQNYWSKVLRVGFQGLVIDAADTVEFTPVSMALHVGDKGKIDIELTPFTVRFNHSQNNTKVAQVAFSKSVFNGQYLQLEKLERPAVIGTVVTDSAVINMQWPGNQSLSVALNKIKVTKTLKAVDDFLNDHTEVSLTVDSQALREQLQSQVPFIPESLQIQYGFKHVSYDLANHLRASINTHDIEAGSKKAIELAQESDPTVYFSARVKTDKGDAYAEGQLAFSSLGRSADISFFEQAFADTVSEKALQLFEADAKVSITKAVADSAKLTSTLAFLGAETKDDQLVFETSLKNGEARLNGRPIMP